MRDPETMLQPAPRVGAGYRVRGVACVIVRVYDFGTLDVGDGHVATLASLHDAHLVNALLASLAAGEPAGITEPLTVEVDRRGLRGRAMEKAEQRTGPHA